MADDPFTGLGSDFRFKVETVISDQGHVQNIDNNYVVYYTKTSKHTYIGTYMI